MAQEAIRTGSSAGAAVDLASGLVAVAGAVLLIGLTSALWHLALAWSDWAAVALVPFAAVCYAGNRSLLLGPWQRTRDVWLRDESWLAAWLTGKLRACVLAALFTAVAVLTLAWQAATAHGVTAAILLAAVAVASGVYVAATPVIARHCREPFARLFASSAGTWLVALPVTLLLAWATYHWVPQTGAVLGASFGEALQIGLEELPDRPGWIPDLLAAPYAFEGIKLWIVVQLQQSPFGDFALALFSLDAALVSVITCRASVAVTQFILSVVATGRQPS